MLLFRQLMTGQMRIDLGLRDGLAEAAKQAATSFVCFCIFRRLLPVQPTIEGAPGKVAKKAGKPAVDPEVLRRFSLLVEEAKRRVEAHRGSSGRGLRRTFSEGTFATPSSPKTPLPRGRLGGNGGPSSSAPDERARRTLPGGRGGSKPHPLLDIRLAGPSSSPHELLAELKSRGRIVHSVSMMSFPRPAPADAGGGEGRG